MLNCLLLIFKFYVPYIFMKISNSPPKFSKYCKLVLHNFQIFKNYKLISIFLILNLTKFFKIYENDLKNLTMNLLMLSPNKKTNHLN